MLADQLRAHHLQKIYEALKKPGKIDFGTATENATRAFSVVVDRELPKIAKPNGLVISGWHFCPKCIHLSYNGPSLGGHKASSGTLCRANQQAYQDLQTAATVGLDAVKRTAIQLILDEYQSFYALGGEPGIFVGLSEDQMEDEDPNDMIPPFCF